MGSAGASDNLKNFPNPLDAHEIIPPNFTGTAYEYGIFREYFDERESRTVVDLTPIESFNTLYGELKPDNPQPSGFEENSLNMIVSFGWIMSTIDERYRYSYSTQRIKNNTGNNYKNWYRYMTFSINDKMGIIISEKMPRYKFEIVHTQPAGYFTRAIEGGYTKSNATLHKDPNQYLYITIKRYIKKGHIKIDTPINIDNVYPEAPQGGRRRTRSKSKSRKSRRRSRKTRSRV